MVVCIRWFGFSTSSKPSWTRILKDIPYCRWTYEYSKQPDRLGYFPSPVLVNPNFNTLFAKIQILYGILGQQGQEKLQVYWLIDAVFSYNRKEEFQIWTLEVKDNQGILTMREDSDRPCIVRQNIPFTDFPDGIFKMYLIDGILILPSEY